MRATYPAVRLLEGPLGSAGMRGAARAGARLTTEAKTDDKAFEKRRDERTKRHVDDYAAKTKEEREAPPPRRTRERKRTRTRTRTRRRRTRT